MYCKSCGKRSNTSDKFCNSCGQNFSQETTEKNIRGLSSIPLKTLLTIIVLIVVIISAFIYYEYNAPNDELDINMQLNGNNLTENEYVSPSLIEVLEPSIQPVGYFDDPDVYDSESISDEEWFSHIQYYDVEDVTFVVDESKYQFPNQKEIFSSVVKVVCENKDGIYSGSGTNVDGTGLVLTNYHVIEGEDMECVVGFPDPVSGLIKEAYWTTPIIDKDDITGHDLAYLATEDPVFDEDYNIYGYYSRLSDGSFPYFEITDHCFNASTQLGDKLFVIGYPTLGGEALTITDGLVSSLYSQDGYIITSARIIRGNSGGTAVDEQGCYVGVPTATYYEDIGEFLGEVIDAEFVVEFDEAVADDIENYNDSI